MNRDDVFQNTAARASDFKFDQRVAEVFDDMLARSVPFYVEQQSMIREIGRKFHIPGSDVYDLGCSTGTTFMHVHKALPADRKLKFIGLDNSQAMLDKAREKLARNGFNREHELRCAERRA